jgi:hypothetical protein
MGGEDYRGRMEEWFLFLPVAEAYRAVMVEW